MNKSVKNAGASMLLVTLLASANQSLALYTIVEDDLPRSAVHATQNITLPSPPEKTEQPAMTERVEKAEASVVPVAPIEQINAVEDRSKATAKKMTTAKKKPVARCPSELACSGDNTRPVNYSIPFVSTKADISESGQKRLIALIPRIKGTKVCIIGRPDITTVAKSDKSTLASSRAYNIRKFLLNNGVTPEAITVTAKTEPYTNDDGTTFSSDVIVIEKQKLKVLNLPPIEGTPNLKNMTFPGTPFLHENAQIALVHGNYEAINFIDLSVKNGSISQESGDHLKALLKHNEVQVINNLSFKRAM
jgi:outer membrane protein OmpA-like peptidoglycan-associated protein